MKTLALTGLLAVALCVSTGAIAQDAKMPDRAERMKQHMTKMFEMVDTDKDGAVSKEEHRAFSDARFEEMDADKNGKVTQDEMHAHRMQKWQDKKGDAPKPEAAPKE